MATVGYAGPPVGATLRRLVELTSRHGTGLAGRDRPTEIAVSRALDLFAACGGTDAAATLVLVGFSGDLLGSIAVDLAADPAAADQLIDRFARSLRYPGSRWAARCSGRRRSPSCP